MNTPPTTKTGSVDIKAELMKKYAPTKGCENCWGDLHQGCSDECKQEFKKSRELFLDLTHLQEQTRREVARQLNLTILMHEQELSGQPPFIESLESKIRAFIRHELLDSQESEGE